MKLRLMVRNAWDDAHISWLLGVDTNVRVSNRHDYLGALAAL